MPCLSSSAAAAVAAEPSTGTWTTVWTDLDYYKGRTYAIEDVPGDDTCYHAFVAYPIDLFKEGPVVNVFASLVGKVFGFKAVHSAGAETGERKGHYLNVTAPTPDEMFKRAEHAKEPGARISMHDYITGGWCANTGLTQ